MRGIARLFFGSLVCMLAVVLSCCQQQIKSPAPSISKLSPPNISAGQPAFTLEVDGNNFTPASLVLWNGSPRTTLFDTTKRTNGADLRERHSECRHRNGSGSDTGSRRRNHPDSHVYD